MTDHEVEIESSVRRSLRTADRFDNYREITAKFDSKGKCGHDIKKGDRIGYNRNHGCRCTDCWDSWVRENHEADMIELGYMPSCY
jgi:hypothetical protein